MLQLKMNSSKVSFLWAVFSICNVLCWEWPDFINEKGGKMIWERLMMPEYENTIVWPKQRWSENFYFNIKQFSEIKPYCTSKMVHSSRTWVFLTGVDLLQEAMVVSDICIDVSTAIVTADLRNEQSVRLLSSVHEHVAATCLTPPTFDIHFVCFL